MKSALWGLLLLLMLAVPRPARALSVAIQGLPAFGFESYDSAGSNYGILLLSKTQLYFGQKTDIFQWGPMVELDFKSLIPEIVAGAGFRLGRRFFFALDGGFFWSRSWGIGGGIAPGIGYQLAEAFYVAFPLMTKVTFGGVLILEYLPHVGVRF